jgi:hypothetical protein
VPVWACFPSPFQSVHADFPHTAYRYFIGRCIYAFYVPRTPPLSGDWELLPGTPVPAGTGSPPGSQDGLKDTVGAMLTVAQDHSHMNPVHHHEQEQSLDKIE